ncbi:MAG: VWA domain-containing protein [Panacagrimonas sp.]
MKTRREVEVFGLSFLDCICCGFGAIVLLLVLSKSAEPTIRVQVTEELDSREAQLRKIGEEASGKRKGLEDQVAATRARLDAARKTLAALRVSSDSLLQLTSETKTDKAVNETVEQRLAAARQSLTEEMRRLQAQGVRVQADSPVGGIPVDSEYIIFVIDTSGSMQRFAWSTMLQTMVEILDIYPKVKGIQVMSDEGAYLFNSYRGQWIPDTPGRRKSTIDALRTWRTFSDSSPVEGIEAAIRAFAEPDKKISIYVLGDDFTGASAENALARVQRINPKDSRGVPRARIHAVGFPTQYSNGGVTATGIRFANLMRIMCERNGGAFVGLTSSR